MAQFTMYPAVVNSPLTELAAAIDAVQTDIAVMDASVLPPAPNLATIGAGDAAETILYTGVDADTLTGVSRGFQGSSKAWSAGAKLARYFTAYDYDAARQNIEDHETRIAGITPAGIGAETPAGAQAKVDAHATRADNPHSVTKAQVGLGSVQNYGVASQAQAEAGATNNVYMTPQRTKQYVDTRLLNNLEFRLSGGVVEYSTNGSTWMGVGGVKSLQSGITEIHGSGASGGSETATDVTLTTAVNMEKSKVITPFGMARTGGNTAIYSVYAYLTSSTNLRIVVKQSSGDSWSGKIAWHVEENF